MSFLHASQTQDDRRIDWPTVAFWATGAAISLIVWGLAIWKAVEIVAGLME